MYLDLEGIFHKSRRLPNGGPAQDYRTFLPRLSYALRRRPCSSSNLTVLRRPGIFVHLLGELRTPLRVQTELTAKVPIAQLPHRCNFDCARTTSYCLAANLLMQRYFLAAPPEIRSIGRWPDAHSVTVARMSTHYPLRWSAVAHRSAGSRLLSQYLQV
jgi:hypothetical protein